MKLIDTNAKTLSISDSVDSIRWNRLVASHNGPMQMTYEWIAYVCAKDGVRPLFFENSKHDGSFIAVTYLSSPKRWPLSKWPTASTDCIPLAKNRVAAITDIEHVLRQKGVSDFQLNSFAFDGATPIELATLGYEENARCEFALSLNAGLETAWLGMRPTLRSDIRRFERSGLDCRIRTDEDIVEALHHIEQETALRHRAQGKLGKPMQEATYRAIWECLVKTGRARVYMAEKHGIGVASVVIGVCGTNAYYLYGGASPDGLSLNAPKGLLWFAIQEEYAKGVREFNLGGMSATAQQPDSLDHGLYKFKTGFGGTERLCVSGHKVFRPRLLETKARLLSLARHVRGVLNTHRDRD